MKVALIGKFHQVGIDILDKKQIQCDQIYDTSPENLIRHLIDVDAIGVRTAKLSRDILESCSKLKIVARHGVGYDSVDLNYLNEKKIPLAVTGTANAVAVAEHVMMIFLPSPKTSS
jgi:D-3-phosphoglycerate dehydrogenase